MKQGLLKQAVIFILVTAFVSGCSKDKDEAANEVELITTVVLAFRDNATNDVFSAVFSDPDGEGGSAPVSFDDIQLKPNSTYSVSVTLINERAEPDEDITGEISDEGEDHQLYFISDGVNITVSTTDQDNNGLPVGLFSGWTTGEAGTGHLRLILKHKPRMKAANDLVTKGETDIDVNFVARVQE